MCFEAFWEFQMETKTKSTIYSMFGRETTKTGNIATCLMLPTPKWSLCSKLKGIYSNVIVVILGCSNANFVFLKLLHLILSKYKKLLHFIKYIYINLNKKFFSSIESIFMRYVYVLLSLFKRDKSLVKSVIKKVISKKKRKREKDEVMKTAYTLIYNKRYISNSLTMT